MMGWGAMLSKSSGFYLVVFLPFCVDLDGKRRLVTNLFRILRAGCGGIKKTAHGKEEGNHAP